jgi:hypothetical protein
MSGGIGVARPTRAIAPFKRPRYAHRLRAHGSLLQKRCGSFSIIGAAKLAVALRIERALRFSNAERSEEMRKFQAGIEREDAKSSNDPLKQEYDALLRRRSGWRSSPVGQPLPEK